MINKSMYLALGVDIEGHINKLSQAMSHDSDKTALDKPGAIQSKINVLYRQEQSMLSYARDHSGVEFKDGVKQAQNAT